MNNLFRYKTNTCKNIFFGNILVDYKNNKLIGLPGVNDNKTTSRLKRSETFVPNKFYVTHNKNKNTHHFF